jgi:tetratricopeptide (TPR) repeat protein
MTTTSPIKRKVKESDAGNVTVVPLMIMCNVEDYEGNRELNPTAFFIVEGIPNPTLLDAWYNKGATFYNLGKNEEALAAFDQVIAINPQLEAAWYNKGMILYNLGRNEEALETYDKIIAINPQLAEAWYNKGIIFDKMGKNEETLAAYDKAIGVNPKYAEAWYNKGVHLYKLERYKDAKIAFENAHKLDPKLTVPLSLTNLTNSDESVNMMYE